MHVRFCSIGCSVVETSETLHLVSVSLIDTESDINYLSARQFSMFACLEWHQDASRSHRSCQVKMKVAVPSAAAVAPATSSRQAATLPSSSDSQPSNSSFSTSRPWRCLTSTPVEACRQARTRSRTFDRNWRCQSHSETESISTTATTSLSALPLLFVFTFLLCASSAPRCSAESLDQFCKLPMHAFLLRALFSAVCFPRRMRGIIIINFLIAP